MPHHSVKIGKTTESATPGKTGTSRAKIKKNSFDDTFTAAFKQINDSQSVFSKMGNMQIASKRASSIRSSRCGYNGTSLVGFNKLGSPRAPTSKTS